MIGVLPLLALLPLAALGGALPPHGRVVNGSNAEPGEFPFQVSLRYNDRHLCGATLLSASWALTAAHCVQEVQNLYSVQAGTIFISEDGDSIIDVEEIFAHDEYDPTNGYINDIALVKVSGEFPLGGPIQTVVLPHSCEYPPPGSPVTLLGWGLNATGGESLPTLQKAELWVVSEEECARAYNYTTHATNICAGVPGGGRGQCNGDSGGPLLAGGVQAGIVSWSHKPCAGEGYPGVYTRVARYVGWIADTLAAAAAAGR